VRRSSPGPTHKCFLFDFPKTFGFWADHQGRNYGFTEEALANAVDKITYYCMNEYDSGQCIGTGKIMCLVDDVTKRTRSQIAALPGVGPAAMRVLRQFLQDHELQLASGWPKQTVTI